MPDGSRVRGCDEQDGLIAPDVALRILLEDAAPLAREARILATDALGRVLARAVVGETEDGLLLVERTGPAGSARLLPLAAADGLLRIPATLEAVPPGGRFGILPLQGLA
jgi:molybdopterin molybdotransferase